MSVKSNAIRSLRHRLGLLGGFASAEILAADRVLTYDDAQILGFDPGGAARNVDLPAVSSQDKGYFFVITNTADAAEALTVRKTGGGATVATLSQSQGGVVFVDKSTGDWALSFVFSAVAS